MNSAKSVLAMCAAGLSALVIVAPSPARADSATATDPADVGGASLNDIRRVHVDFSGDRLAVVVKVTDLRKTSEAGGASLSTFVDTDAALPGPEFRLATGLYSGTDYQLVRFKAWKPTGSPLTCRHSVALKPRVDRVRLVIGRKCLGSPGKVRVGMKMVDNFDGSHPITDWLFTPRTLSAWIAHS